MSVTNRLVFDPTSADVTSSVGAYIRAGTDGDLIGSETLNSLEWLRVASAIVDSAGNEVAVTANALDVNIASGSLLLDGYFDEDAAHTSGDIGIHNLAVRQDTLASSTSADGDYGSMKQNAKGELYVKDADVLAELAGGIVVSATDLDIRDLDSTSDSVAAWLSDGSGNAIGSTGGSLDVNVTNTIDVDDGLANTAIENTATAVSTTAVNVVSAALASRKYMYLANLGNKDLYFGKTGVTVANGFPLFPGEKMQARIGSAVAAQVIGGTGASSEDLRVMELS